MAVEVEALTTELVLRLRGLEPNPILKALVAPIITELHGLLGTSTIEGVTGKASSIFHARWLSMYRSPTVGTKFVTPFIAYREGPVARRDRTTEVFIFRVYAYDEPGRGYWSINKIVPLISRALTQPPLQVATGAATGDMGTNAVSGATVDAVNNLAMRYLTFSVDATWL